MTKEEKEAIHMLQSYAGMTHKLTDNQGRPKLDQAIDVVLNLIQKQQVEIEKKDKIIEELEDIFYDYQLCEYEITDCTYRKCEDIADDKEPPCKQCIKQYFEKKVEEK